jgi:sigma-B regulation protein RsbU (phosphoserine phosphatase)
MFVARGTRAEMGDLLVMYTDGLIEIQNKEGRMLGLERFKEIVRGHARKPLREAFDGVMAEANAFGTTNDDQTLVMVRVGFFLVFVAVVVVIVVSSSESSLT